jgi:zinc protease
VGDSINDLVHFGWPDDYYDTEASKIRALKPADVAAAAKTIVHPDNLIWVVVGDRAKIEAGIKELGLGEIRLLDADGKPI